MITPGFADFECEICGFFTKGRAVYGDRFLSICSPSCLSKCSELPFYETLSDSAKLLRIGQILVEEGCSCECEHHYEEHDDECELCLGCRISEVL